MDGSQAAPLALENVQAAIDGAKAEALAVARSECSVAVNALRSEFVALSSQVSSDIADIARLVDGFHQFLVSEGGAGLVSLVETRLAPLENAVSAFFEKHFPHVFDYRAPAPPAPPAQSAEAQKSA